MNDKLNRIAFLLQTLYLRHECIAGIARTFEHFFFLKNSISGNPFTNNIKCGKNISFTKYYGFSLNFSNKKFEQSNERTFLAMHEWNSVEKNWNLIWKNEPKIVHFEILKKKSFDEIFRRKIRRTHPIVPPETSVFRACHERFDHSSNKLVEFKAHTFPSNGVFGKVQILNEPNFDVKILQSKSFSWHAFYDGKLRWNMSA